MMNKIDNNNTIHNYKLECGSIAVFDVRSGCSHICSRCLAVVGSVGMPRQCKDLEDMAEVAAKLKGKK